ncbi:hypothetical protein Taro_000955 [Colocasia esculenta]|uniref:Uncharacterized protein n=1 Tax=Colocasia esculenta TaxID=4460 RepID=A0A843T8N1_COLES|nr:hypothetical protein [Colocasia esculenta]
MVRKMGPRRGARSQTSSRPVPAEDDVPQFERKTKRRNDLAEQPGSSSEPQPAAKRESSSSSSSELVREFYKNLKCTDEGFQSKVKGIAIDLPTDIAASIFKVPDEGADYHNFEFDLHEAYTIMTGLPADASDPKQTFVTKFNTNTFPPVLRVIHHMLTTIITPQGGGRDRLTDIQRKDLKRSLPYAAHLTSVFQHFGLRPLKLKRNSLKVKGTSPKVKRNNLKVKGTSPRVKKNSLKLKGTSPKFQHFSPHPSFQASTSSGGPSVPPEFVSAKFIEQKAASDYAAQRFNRLIGTLADASGQLKEHQQKLEIVLQGILANSQADVFNTKQTLQEITSTRLSFAHFVDDLESMRNFNAHIDNQITDLKKEFKIMQRPELGQQVDTTTRVGRHWINSQNSLFAEWDSRSTQDESRSTLDLVPRTTCFQVWDSVSTPPPGQVDTLRKDSNLRWMIATCQPRAMVYQPRIVCPCT